MTEAGRRRRQVVDDLRARAIEQKVAFALRLVRMLTGKHVSGPGAVMGAFGYDLLAPVKYWTLVKKLSLLAAVDAGTLAFDQVRVAHALTEEEIDSWRRLYERHGAAGLRATKLQAYRDLDGGGSA